MIPNQWYAVLESREVPRGKAIGVTRLGEKLVFWRDPLGDLTCFVDLCPHRGAALSLGRVAGDCLECPFHGFRYDQTGACRLIPANGRSAPTPKSNRVKTYTTRDAHGFVWMWWGEPREALPPVPFFKDLDDSFSYSTLRDHWPVHYSRAIENQLDVVHLPFIHATTIGRGNRTLVDGPLVRLEDDELAVWVYNRVDDGTPPLKPQEVPTPKRPPFLVFRFPSIWQLRIGDDYRILVAFVPIDEGNTLLYARTYQRAVRVPILREVASYVANLSSRVIIGQDKRVVITQRPIKTQLKMGEKLVQGDRPIVVYRSRREELIQQAQPESPQPVEQA